MLVCGLTIAGQNVVTVSGRVSDEGGAAIARTRVSFEDASGKVSSELSNKDGGFEFRLMPGVYKVTARYEEHQAWEQFLLNGYQVAEGGKPLEIVLKVSQRWADDHGTPVEGTLVEKEKIARPANETDYSILTGTVFDDYGSIIVGAKIVASGRDGTKWEAFVDEKFVYVLELPLGTYTLQISKEGFCPAVFREYRIVKSTFGKLSLDVALNVGGSHTTCSQGDTPTMSDKTNKSINKKNNEQLKFGIIKPDAVQKVVK